jgi:hypothetical protein
MGVGRVNQNFGQSDLLSINSEKVDTLFDHSRAAAQSANATPEFC